MAQVPHHRGVPQLPAKSGKPLREVEQGRGGVPAHGHRHCAGVVRLAKENQLRPLQAGDVRDDANLFAAPFKHRALFDVRLQAQAIPGRVKPRERTPVVSGGLQGLV